MDKTTLYYEIPIFAPANSIELSANPSKSANLKSIGEGSYAKVFKYKDEFYNKHFALKRANKDLNENELERFRREFEAMKELNSPYILEVYSFNSQKNEYIMEYADFTLRTYIDKHNNNLDMQMRKKYRLTNHQSF